MSEPRAIHPFFAAVGQAAKAMFQTGGPAAQLWLEVWRQADLLTGATIEPIRDVVNDETIEITPDVAIAEAVARLGEVSTYDAAYAYALALNAKPERAAQMARWVDGYLQAVLQRALREQLERIDADRKELDRILDRDRGTAPPAPGTPQ